MEHFKLFFITASFLFPFALSVVFFLDFRKNTSRKIMAFALLNTAQIFLCNYFFLQQDYSVYYPLHSLNAALQFTVFPLIYLYIRSIVSPKDKIKHQLLHLLPSVLMFFVASYIFYIYTSKKDMLYFLEHNRQGDHFEEYSFFVLKVSRYVHLTLIAIQGALYAMAFIRIPKEFDLKLRNEFSNIENFSINWINKYLLSFAVVVAGGFVAYAIFPLKGVADFIIKLLFFVFSAFVCRLGILALRQQQVAEIDLDDIIPDVVLQSEQAQITDTKLVKKLTEYMIKKQLYLQPDISLTSLACTLGTNRTYLSAIINQQYGMNFNAYINSLRAEFAKQFLEENPNTKKEELCHKAGFGSISTMQRAMNGKG
jgi:AraC-like DNA-binding protein